MIVSGLRMVGRGSWSVLDHLDSIHVGWPGLSRAAAQALGPGAHHPRLVVVEPAVPGGHRAIRTLAARGAHAVRDRVVGDAVEVDDAERPGGYFGEAQEGSACYRTNTGEPGDGSCRSLQ